MRCGADAPLDIPGIAPMPFFSEPAIPGMLLISFFCEPAPAFIPGIPSIPCMPLHIFLRRSSANVFGRW